MLGIDKQARRRRRRKQRVHGWFADASERWDQVRSSAGSATRDWLDGAHAGGRQVADRAAHAMRSARGGASEAAQAARSGWSTAADSARSGARVAADRARSGARVTRQRSADATQRVVSAFQGSRSERTPGELLVVAGGAVAALVLVLALARRLWPGRAHSFERGSGPGTLPWSTKAKQSGQKPHKPWGKRPNVVGAERVGSYAAGGLLVAAALQRRDGFGIAAGALGGVLLVRGATGRCAVKRALARNERPHRLHDSISVAGTPQQAWALWRDLEQLPHFLPYLRAVRVINDQRSWWSLRLADRRSLEVAVDLVRDEPGQRLEWRTRPNAILEHRGVVTFRSSGSGTVIDVDLIHAPGPDVRSAWPRLRAGLTSQRLSDGLERCRAILEQERSAAETETVVDSAANGEASR